MQDRQKEKFLVFLIAKILLHVVDNVACMKLTFLKFVEISIVAWLKKIFVYFETCLFSVGHSLYMYFLIVLSMGYLFIYFQWVI